jgi:hypothetical protein
MSTHTRYQGQPAKTSHPHTRPRCPYCGGLECLCRPTFFAGQLLTERELNGVERYVIEKNKLHNRYLHGWGVVCGLDVYCDSCDPCERDGVQHVLVTEGYALSPCGEDIVLCRDEHVPVCELIQKCRPHEPECEDEPRRDPCRERPEEWVLAVCYDERPSRGITPLRSPDCCPSCGCASTTSGSSCGCKNGNGNGNGSCGCKNGTSASHGHAGTRLDRCSAPLECEPTIICEGHRFVVWKQERRRPDDRRGTLEERFRACLAEFERYVPSRPSSGVENDREAWADWFSRWKQGIRDYALGHTLYRCDLLAVIDRLYVADPQRAEFVRTFPQLARSTEIIEALIRLTCLCSALHPPCPDEVHDNCVPLAVLTVDREREACRVRSICTWTTLRRPVVTFPNLGYWLSPLPFGRWFRAILQSLCCELPKRGRGEVSSPGERFAAASSGRGADAERTFESNDTGGTAMADERGDDGDEREEDRLELRIPSLVDDEARLVAGLAAQAFVERHETRGLLEAMEATLGEGIAKDRRAAAVAPEGHEALFLLLDQIGKPLARATVNGAGLAPPGRPAPTEVDPETELRNLRETVSRQSERIDELMRRLGGT